MLYSSWLLHDPKMKVRSNYPGYTEAVEKYFAKLIPMVADLQVGSVYFRLRRQFKWKMSYSYSFPIYPHGRVL